MTGVEAVSDGVPIFRDPPWLGARRTLAAIVGILIALLVGVVVVVRAHRIMPTPPARAGYESLLSQLVAAVVGRGPFYYLTIAAIISVLALSANTSFADFPRLCQRVASDHFLPEPFLHRGRRLVFSQGVIVLSVVAGALIVAFRGITDFLIPLFATGAFLAFTMSQIAMVMHWHKAREKGKVRLVLNAAGAVATGITAIVVLVSKLAEGA